MLLAIGISFVAGAITGIFFYRNNEDKVSKIADKVDDLHDEVKGK